MKSLSLVLVAVFSSSAIADDNPEAQQLFEKGRSLVKAGDHAQACPLFEKALQLQEALGTELNLAVCWAKVGRLRDARQLFQTILRKTSTPDQAQRHKLAQDALADIAKRMPTLQIERGELPAGTTVWVDGTELTDPTEPVEIDPGEHVVTAKGATKQTVIAVEGQVVEVILVAGASEEPEPETPPPASGGGFFSGDRRPLYVAGAGAALLVAGTITGILTFSKKGEGLDLCDGPDDMPVCGPDGRAALDSARTYSHLSTAFFLVGGGLVVTGVIWKLKTGRTDDQPAVTGWITGDGGGFAWQRTW